MNLPSNVGYARNRDLANQRGGIERATTQPSATGARVSSWPTGTLVTGGLTRAQRRVGSRKHPFQLTGFVESGSLKISIYPGMVNNFVPTIGGTSLAALPPPSITVTGSSGVIQLRATVDAAGAITALIAENVTGPSVTADTSTEKYKLVGSWTASGGAFTGVTSILNTNQALYVCNGVAIWEA